MAFKITPDPTFTAKFNFVYPGGDTTPVSVEYKYHDKTQLDEYYQQVKGKTNFECLDMIIVSWEGFHAPWSEQAYQDVASKYPSAPAQFYDAFHRELLGARRKN